MGRPAGATRLAAGYYEYRGCVITQNHDSADYVGWWMIHEVGCSDDFDYYPTKRAAIAAIDADPR